MNPPCCFIAKGKGRQAIKDVTYSCYDITSCSGRPYCLLRSSQSPVRSPPPPIWGSQCATPSPYCNTSFLKAESFGNFLPLITWLEKAEPSWRRTLQCLAESINSASDILLWWGGGVGGGETDKGSGRGRVGVGEGEKEIQTKLGINN